MKLKHRLLVFAALGPTTAFAVMAVEVLLTTLFLAATGLGPPAAQVWASTGLVARNAISPVFLILFALFAGAAALSGLAVDMAERHERTRPMVALAACCAAVTFMAILPGFFTVLVFTSAVGGVLAGLIAGAAATLLCWLIAPRQADPGPAPRPRSPLTAQYASRAGQGAGFGRR
ncbi:MAG: hypothetical protein ABIO39_08170 [Caulobacteraceae bacterium]